MIVTALFEADVVVAATGSGALASATLGELLIQSFIRSVHFPLLEALKRDKIS